MPRLHGSRSLSTSFRFRLKEALSLALVASLLVASVLPLWHSHSHENSGQPSHTCPEHHEDSSELKSDTDHHQRDVASTENQEDFRSPLEIQSCQLCLLIQKEQPQHANVHQAWAPQSFPGLTNPWKNQSYSPIHVQLFYKARDGPKIS